MELATLSALLSPAGQALLAEVEREYDGDNALAVADRLRRSHPSDVVAAALTQAQLRRRAVDKLGPAAARMYFTPEALEQATRRAVAEHRARRISTTAGSVLDLGCGIGGDLIPLAARGLAVTGVEQDPVRSALARANLDAVGLPGTVVTADAAAVDRSGHDAVFADPARRAGGRRLFDPAAYSPSWDVVLELLAATACVKVAPGIPHRLVPEGVEAEWVSDAGELKEAALWSGRLAGTQRRATLLPGGATLTEADDPGEAPVVPVRAYLYEPDDAVIRAGLVTAVAAAVAGGLLDPRIAYVASDHPVETPFARAYRVLERLPFREKQLRAALRERAVGTLTIKKRGVDVLPEQLRSRLGLRGELEATLVLTRAAGRATALLVEPIGRTAPVQQPVRASPGTGTGNRPGAAARPRSTSTSARIAPGVEP